MEGYELVKPLGEGTYGCVWRAVNRRTKEIVAIKRLKRKYVYSTTTWEECLKLREVKVLRKMEHPHIVKLKEVIRELDTLYLVFENMECSLYDLMKRREKPFSENEIRDYCFQIFHALSYMHGKKGYFHRDMKPDNLLVTEDVVKIADFGFARKVYSQPPFTEYVTTRWYRAPEVLLSSSIYGSAVDIWAMGAIMAELFTLRPLFPGTSEADQIHKICTIIGTPTESSWSQGLLLASNLNYQFPKVDAVDLSILLPTASKSAVNLIASLCSWDPKKRPTAAEVLHHPFFLPCYSIPPSLQVEESLLPKASPPPPAAIADGPPTGFSQHGIGFPRRRETESWDSNKGLSEVMKRLQQLFTVGNYHQQAGGMQMWGVPARGKNHQNLAHTATAENWEPPPFQLWNPHQPTGFGPHLAAAARIF